MKIYKLEAGVAVVRSPNHDRAGSMAFRVISGAHYRARLYGGIMIAHWLGAEIARDGETLVDACRRAAEQSADYVLASARYALSPRP